MTTDHSKQNPHVAVFTYPYISHAKPLFNLTHHLANSLPSVHFSFFNTSECNNALFSSCDKPAAAEDRSKQVQNLSVYDFWDGVPDGYVLKGTLHEQEDLLMKAAPESFRKAIAEAADEVGLTLSCIVGDAFFWFLGELAEEMSVPWFACWTAGEHTLSAHVYTDLLRQKIGLEGVEEKRDQLVEFIPGMSKIRAMDLPDGVVTKVDGIFAKMQHQMSRKLPQANAVLINSFEELDPSVTNDLKSKFQNFLNIGPFHLTMPQQQRPQDPNSCLKWLDKQKPKSVVYICFGTGASPSPNEIVALAEALDESGLKFLWILKERSKVHLPNGFLERLRSGGGNESGMVAPWVPQVEVLRHEAVGVFVTHFGWNSVLESMECEVPMLGRPFWGDQKLNGRLVEAIWEIGLVIEGGVITKEGVIRSLEKILMEDEGSRMRGNIKVYKELVIRTVRSDGRSRLNFNTLLSMMVQ